MTMSYIFAICASCFLLCSTVVYSQVEYQISGYIVDAETGEPVSYASIGVPQQEKGISSNINGYFNLLLSENNPDHSLRISSIGYQQLSISLSDVKWGQEQTIQLVPETRLLKEIVILGKSQSIDEAIKSTSKNRKRFLRSRPYLMHGLYRELLKVDGNIEGFTEGHGILYMNGYDPRYKNNKSHLTYDLIQWKHLRRSDYPTASYIEIAALLKAKDYYLHEGPLKKGNLNKFTYRVTDSTTYQDRLVLEVEFNPRKDFQNELRYHGRMYIKEDDQALLRLEIESTGPEPYLKSTESEDQIIGQFDVSFILFDGQYYLGKTSYQRYYAQEGQQFDWKMELLGASFTNQPAMFLNTRQRTVLFSEMLNPRINYDPGFWDSFTLVPNDELDRLDLDPNIKSQFQAHHEKRLKPLPDGFETYEQMSNDRNALDFMMQR